MYANKIIDKLRLKELLKSMKECWNDNRGGFLIPISAKLIDPDYEHYRFLPVNWSIPSITEEHLPLEFSSKAVKTVDMFRRKTFDLPYECMIMFDYITGNIVSCNFSSQFGDRVVESLVYPDVLKGMHIASIHNHPIQFCAPPSSKNFQMLGFNFEEFELISSKNELWILESREVIFNEDSIDEIRENAENYFNLVYEDAFLNFNENYLFLDNVNKIYGDFLLDYLNNEVDNIKITRRYLDD